MKQVLAIQLCLAIALFTCAMILRQKCKRVEELENVLVAKNNQIDGLRFENADFRGQIKSLESTIAQSEELMQEYDAAFNGVKKLMKKYPEAL